VQTLTTSRFGVGGARFRVGGHEGPADTATFGCFRRRVFDEVGLFDERLVRNQDYEFNKRLKAAGKRIWLNPDWQRGSPAMPDERWKASTGNASYLNGMLYLRRCCAIPSPHRRPGGRPSRLRTAASTQPCWPLALRRGARVTRHIRMSLGSLH
jgi:hypothetical protein